MTSDAVAFFFERDDAEAVAARLADAGLRVRVARERLHGEDDDEDHPWVVVTDPSGAALLDALASEHDGWPDAHDPAAAPVVPPPLPTAPRRLKNPPA